LEGAFGKSVAVFDQDQVNLVKFQAGLRQNGLKQIHLANYQERNVRNFLNGVERRVRAGHAEAAAGDGARQGTQAHG
jgi:hypothetical protein